MKTNLERIKNKLVEDAKKTQEKIENDFMHAYEWDYVSDLYKLKFKVQYVDYLLEKISSNDITLEKILNSIKDEVFTARIESSTNQGSNRASILRIDALKELHSDLAWGF